MSKGNGDLSQNTAQALERRVAQLEAKEAIREGLYRYARAVDRCDVDLLKQCYHPGAKDVHWVFIGDATEFSDFVIEDMRQYRSVRHVITNMMIELEGDRAFVESWYSCVLRLDMDGGAGGEFVEQLAQGRYCDIWEQRSGAWRIAHRHLVDDGFVIRLVVDQPPYEAVPNRNGTTDRSDPVYSRFDIPSLMPAPYRSPPTADQTRTMFQPAVNARRAQARAVNS